MLPDFFILNPVQPQTIQGTFDLALVKGYLNPRGFKYGQPLPGNERNNHGDDDQDKERLVQTFANLRR